MPALKAGSALSNPEDEVADTARQNVRFGAAHLTGSATSIGARNGVSARSSWPLSSLSVMSGQGATHRAAAPSCTPATRDRAGRLHRDVPGRPAVCRNPGLLDDPALASVSRPGSPGVRRHPADSRPSRSPLLEPRRHPGVPAGASARSCAVTLDQPHRRGDGPRAAGAARQYRKTLSAAREGVLVGARSWSISPPEPFSGYIDRAHAYHHDLPKPRRGSLSPQNDLIVYLAEPRLATTRQVRRGGLLCGPPPFEPRSVTPWKPDPRRSDQNITVGPSK